MTMISTNEKKPLTDPRIRSLKEPGTYSEGTVGGLFLIITPKGSKRWRLRCWVNGKEVVVGLGDFEQVGLKDAKKAAEDAKAQASRGTRPISPKRAGVAAQRAKDSLTFDVVAKEYVKWQSKKDDWAAKTLDSHRYALDANILPIMGTVAVADVQVTHIKDMIEGLRGKRAAARYALGVVKRILNFAVVSQYVKANVAADCGPLLQKPKKGEPAKKHHPAIKEAGELASFLRRLDAYPGNESAIYGLKLLVMLPARASELSSMRWEDIDLEAGRWTFMMSKVSRKHMVPLPRQAVAILEELLERRTGKCEYVLPSPLDATRPIQADALRLALVRRLGYRVGEVSAHGFRATFQTLARKPLGVDTEVLELALGHNTTAAYDGAYDRNEFIEERVEAAQRYANYLDELRNGL